MTHPYIRKIAEEVVAGKWDNGYLRYIKLRQAGFDYNIVHREVNKIMERRRRGHQMAR